ncbi:MAG: spore coat protein [Moorellales bacterium]
MANFTQPELQQLRENLSSELLVISKLASFAAQIDDPQLKQMCINMQRTHERHRDMLLRHLNAGQPTM